LVTRNIAKSGEVLNWGGFSPFQLHLDLIVNCSQSASCHIATVMPIVSIKNYLLDSKVNEMFLEKGI